MSRPKKKDRNSRTIVLKIETYERLDKYKVKLISEKGTSHVTFDDVINSLLEKNEVR